MEENKKHANELADDDDMGFNADDDHACAFENDLEQLVENMEPQPRRDVNDLVAVVDLVKAPELVGFMAKKMPSVDGEIESDEGDDPFERTVRPAA